jgi:hypothetical protein
MYEFDHMLNGTGSRQHLQQMVCEAQQDRFARDVEAAAQAERKSISALRALLAAIVNLLVRS